MDNKRLLVWATFGLLLWLTYEAWMQDYGPKPPPATERATSEQSVEPPPAADSLPDLSETPAPAAVSADTPPPPGAAAVAADAPVVAVFTDVFHIEISTRGGTLQSAEILKYPVEKDEPDNPVTLLNTSRSELGLIQTGLRSRGGGAEANQNATFEAPQHQYRLSGDELVVPLTWSDGEGTTVLKRYRFTRGSYRIDVEQTVVNETAEAWQGAEYAQILRRSFEQERSMFDVDSYSFDGPLVYDGERSEKLDRDELGDGPYRYTASGGWVAAIEHHFLSAIVPPPEGPYDFQVSTADNVATASLIGRSRDIAPGSRHTFETTVFVGPKLQRQLEEIAPTLTLAVDYGWLTLISEPLFLLLSWVHGWVGNWGVAIVIVTILIKLVFYKLTEASGRSMAKMRKIQPRMKALQERYKDDRQQLSQAMMELYRREKVNPAAGCLPILVQMPFFLAFYWVLLESVEMRQAPFALWITDLSSRDPYFILPIIMGAAMLAQQKLNPAPADPVQARVMQIMPIVFTAFFAFFPSGLVLYWVTNTVLSIAQQWRINKVVEDEDRRKRGVGKKAKKDKG